MPTETPIDRLSSFRLGDVRGIYPNEINEDFVHKFAQSLVGLFNLKGKIVTGRDMRASSAPLQQALNSSLKSIGINVIDIGLVPTELGYFASAQPGIEAAIIVTASHNPSNYNGLKCVLKKGEAITVDTGLNDIKSKMLEGYQHPIKAGSIEQQDFRDSYVAFLETQFQQDQLAGGRIALNGLNGTAATMAGSIGDRFSIDRTWFRKEPGPIPSQGADPANPKLAKEMKDYMTPHEFDLGVAWDGDCDRCVFFDASGDLIPTYYMVGLFTDHFLKKYPKSAIVFDTKLYWNTIDIIKKNGGVPVPAKTGHGFMKQRMHQSHASYGGELSAHHYFGNFFGCDSGMYAWLTLLTLFNRSEQTLAEMIAESRTKVCCTPELSLDLTNPEEAFKLITNHYKTDAIDIDHFDGIHVTLPDNCRFSLTPSKTEPLVRVNFESRGQGDTLLNHANKVIQMLEPFRADDADWQQHLRLL
jgi:phosphomannomutase